ncbi:MAG: hypothetical protein ACRELF_22080, partial [Gemmataceae bacterium]
MSKVAKSGPLPFDAEAAALEEQRREEQRNNAPLQAGIAAAKAQAQANRRNELTGELAALQRMKLGQGSPRANRDGYDRVYARLTRLAQSIADDTGAAVSIPEYDPPIVPGEGKQTTIKPRSAAEQIAATQY